jgi:hypothetical protein
VNGFHLSSPDELFLRQAESCPLEAMSWAFGIGQNDRCDINPVWDIFTLPNRFGNYAVLYKETLGLTCQFQRQSRKHFAAAYNFNTNPPQTNTKPATFKPLGRTALYSF